jgi:alkylation response protein AidB-like acyl-CoA dehydrogenase
MFIIKQREDENFKPVLARIDGDPPGTPGISIFVVPKHYVNPDSYICEPKDFTTTGIEHKMGIKGAATCSLSLTQKKRIQDADSARKGDFTSVPIIKHPDVRRMLLWMKSQVEAIMIAI